MTLGDDRHEATAGTWVHMPTGLRHSIQAKTPVVMLSSKDGLFDRARGRMVGSDQYLTKPFTKESLLKAVGTHVKAAAH